MGLRLGSVLGVMSTLAYLGLASGTAAHAVPLDLSTKTVRCAASQDSVPFAGRIWRVKRSNTPVGPGPNLFSGSNVCLGPKGLHLRITPDRRGRWRSGEVFLPTSLGYGTYEWTVAGRVDRLNAQAVLGLFVYESDNKEIDIEFARWGWAADPTNAQYVVQPWDEPGNLQRFTMPELGSSVHRFTWQPGSVAFVSRAVDGRVISEWVYRGVHVPTPGAERVHMNLWSYQGAPLAQGARQDEVVISDFSFTPGEQPE